MIPVPTIETDRMILRGPRAADQDGFAAFLMSDRAKYAGGTQDKATAVAEFQEMITYWDSGALGTFIMTGKQHGQTIGHVGGLMPEGWPEAELGWSIWRDEDEGKGYASEAALAVLDYAFNEAGWDTAVSYIAPDNKRSITMTERLGATLDTAAAKPEGLTCLVYRHPNLSGGDGGMEAYV